MHENHKLIEVSDGEALKKENISLETSTKNFDSLLEKINFIKKTVEEEIIKINNLYEKVNEDLTKSYQIKHEKLNKEEKEIRENLQNQVTKTKEKLEIFLSESNNEIKLTNRIKQGLLKLEKEEEKSIYKTLSYISKMNKNDKALNKLSLQILNNIDFSYNEENNNIEYEEYTINGMKINKIDINDITSNSCKISCDFENTEIINNDFKKIELIIELKRENIEENFKQIYKGKYMKAINISGLFPDTNYVLRINFLCGEITGTWSKPKKIKTNDIGSKILSKCKFKKDYIKKLFDWTNVKTKKFDLIFRGTRDGSSCEKFHELCDNQGPTVVLCENERGNIFGGYASISWQNSGNLKSAPDSFLFTLTNIYDIEPTKFSSKNDEKEVYHNSCWGSRFGNGRDIGINGDMFKTDWYTYFPDTYIDCIGKGKSIFTGDFNGSTDHFKIKEIEVFKCE